MRLVLKRNKMTKQQRFMLLVATATTFWRFADRASQYNLSN